MRTASWTRCAVRAWTWTLRQKPMTMRDEFDLDLRIALLYMRTLALGIKVPGRVGLGPSRTFHP